MFVSFDLQGHRGARGLDAENTLPSFEAAFDCGVTSVETDLHLSRDGVVVLCHDPRLPDGVPVATLDLAALRRYRLDRHDNSGRFPTQSASPRTLANWYAQVHDIHPYALPTLADLFAFAAAYAGEPGRQCGKSEVQRARAAAVRFDLELKRVPFYPEAIGDSAGLLEQRVGEAIRSAGVVERTGVRSFDHRCVQRLRRLEPGLTGAVLVAETAPIVPAELALRADATVYCPSFHFLDEALVRELHAAGVRVVPYTVNEPAQWRRLLDWGVDGITTDYPDRLADFLRAAGRVY